MSEWLMEKKKKSETATCSTRWDRSINFLLYWAIFATVVAWFFCSSLMSLEIICHTSMVENSEDEPLWHFQNFLWLQVLYAFLKLITSICLILEVFTHPKFHARMQKDLEKVSPGAKLIYYLNAGAMDTRGIMPNLTWQGCSICTDIRADCKSQGSLNVILPD